MTEETSSIFDPDLYKPKISRYYGALIICFLTYIAFCAWSLVRQTGANLSSMAARDWPIFFLVMSIPLAGLLFFVTKKKIGWAICLCYYMFAAVAYAAGQIDLLISTNSDYNGFSHWGPLTLILLSTISTIVLLSRDIRIYFSINSTWLRVSIIVSVLLACPVVIMMFNN